MFFQDETTNNKPYWVRMTNFSNVELVSKITTVKENMVFNSIGITVEDLKRQIEQINIVGEIAYVSEIKQISDSKVVKKLYY